MVDIDFFSRLIFRFTFIWAVVFLFSFIFTLLRTETTKRFLSVLSFTEDMEGKCIGAVVIL